MKYRSVITVLCFLMYALDMMAQDNVEYTVKNMDDGLLCETSKIFQMPTSQNPNTYLTSFWLNYPSTPPMSLFVILVTNGDKDIVSIARMDKGGSHTTNAYVEFANGDKQNFFTTVTDNTRPEMKNTTTAALYIGLILTNEAADMLRFGSTDIKSITIGGHTIQMSNTSVKTAPIIDQMYKRIFTKIISDNKAQSNATRSNDSVGPATRDKTAVDLVCHPFGILAKDGEGLTYENEIKILKAQTAWKVERSEYTDKYRRLSFGPISEKYDITWQGHAMESAWHYCNDSPNEYDAGTWGYHLAFKLADYSREKSTAIALQFVEELRKAGFAVENNSNTWNGELLVNKMLKKGAYTVDVKMRLLPSWDATHLYITINPKGNH